LEPNLETEPGQELGQGTVGSTRVDSSQHMNKKIIIIIVLKLDSRINPGKDSGHESEGSTQVDPNLQKNQSNLILTKKKINGILPMFYLRSTVSLVNSGF
jgi:hypothetical protein